MPRDLTDTARLQLILSLAQGARTMFDQKTHRQVRQVYNRFSYVFLIAKLLDGREPRELVERVLDHLDEAREALQMAWGEREYARISSNAQTLADFGEPAKRGAQILSATRSHTRRFAWKSTRFRFETAAHSGAASRL